MGKWGRREVFPHPRHFRQNKIVIDLRNDLISRQSYKIVLILITEGISRQLLFSFKHLKLWKTIKLTPKLFRLNLQRLIRKRLHSNSSQFTLWNGESYLVLHGRTYSVRYCIHEQSIYILEVRLPRHCLLTMLLYLNSKFPHRLTGIFYTANP